MYGNGGSDIFAVGGYTGPGYGMIMDFNRREDKLQLSRGVAYTFKQFGSSTGIYSGNDMIAYLNGVSLGNGVITTQSWAIFA